MKQSTIDEIERLEKQIHQKSHYTMKMLCTNCNYRGNAEYKKGQRKYCKTCPECGCITWEPIA